MTIANVALSDTFDLWRTRFNQTAVISNLITEGQANTTGTLTISNPSYINGNVSLNVSNGVIRVSGNTFSSNAVPLISNSATLTISGTGRLGTPVYFDIGTLSVSVYDNSIANIASANSVNTAYNTATAAFGAANAAFAVANTGNGAIYIANLAFDKANSGGSGYFRGNNGDKGLVAAMGDLFRINANTLTANIGFDNGENAMTTGPITIDANRYLTINTGARVVIV
tara:strand:+ start:261 stop:941 length:681 start_codon:yes stop_codon:yes gene_type:complete